LTALPRACYSAIPCPCGGIGRRARLKIEFRKECWFDPGQGHHFDPIDQSGFSDRSLSF
jgi:hypothetical protein